MNFKKLAFITLAALLSFGFIGCKHKVGPVPYDTADKSGMGSNGSGAFGVDVDNQGLEDLGFDGPRAGIDGQIRGQFQDVYFDFESSAIKPTERAKISQAADRLRSNPAAKLVLEGHCDWRGTAEYNLALGDRRAASVKRYLETLGISGSRLDVTSKGDQEAVEGGSAAAMAKDRRVEIILVP